MLFLTAHRYAVRTLAWSPRGDALASGGDDRAVRVWRLPTGELRHDFQGHTQNVYAVGFCCDGQGLLSAGGDGAVRLWSLATGVMRTTPTLHSRSVNALAIHPRAGVATADGAWRSPSRTLVRRWAGRGFALRRDGPTLALDRQEVSCLAFSPDGRTLAAGTPWMLFLWTPRREASHVMRWGACHAGARPTLEATVTGDLAAIDEGGWFRSVAFSPDGEWLAAAADMQVRLWERRSGRLVGALAAHAATVNAVAFSPAGGLLASGGDDGTVRLWDVPRGRERVSFAWSLGEIAALAFSPDGISLAAGGRGRIVVWDVEEYY